MLTNKLQISLYMYIYTSSYEWLFNTCMFFLMLIPTHRPGKQLLRLNGCTGTCSTLDSLVWDGRRVPRFTSKQLKGVMLVYTLSCIQCL